MRFSQSIGCPWKLGQALRQVPHKVLPAAILAALTAVTAPVFAQDNPTVAIVNGSEIKLSELLEAKQNLPQQYRNAPLQALYEPLLDRLISMHLMGQQAESLGLAKNPEIAQQIAASRLRILQQGYVRQLIADATQEDKLRSHYDTNIAGKPGAEEVRARHILVDNEEKAAELSKQAKEGADFATLAKDNSTGPSGSNGGDLGYFEHGQMVKPFADTAFAMAPGAISDPVQTRFGWHVIKVEDKRQKETPSYEDSVEGIRQQIASDTVNTVMAELQQSAEIQRFDAEGKPLPLTAPDASEPSTSEAAPEPSTSEAAPKPVKEKE